MVCQSAETQSTKWHWQRFCRGMSRQRIALAGAKSSKNLWLVVDPLVPQIFVTCQCCHSDSCCMLFTTIATPLHLYWYSSYNSNYMYLKFCNVHHGIPVFPWDHRLSPKQLHQAVAGAGFPHLPRQSRWSITAFSFKTPSTVMSRSFTSKPWLRRFLFSSCWTWLPDGLTSTIKPSKPCWRT